MRLISLSKGPARAAAFLLLSALCLAMPADISARQVTVTDTVPIGEATEALATTAMTPRGAFFRSLLVPGWGHVATESYGRAGFYVAAQSGSLWMLVQTMERRAEAKARLDLERDLVRARWQAGGALPDSIVEPAVDRDAGVVGRQELVDARDDQVEDWAALSIFIVLLGATDAFVAAHLADFPEPLSLDVSPTSLGAEIRLSLPFTGASPGGRSRTSAREASLPRE